MQLLKQKKIIVFLIANIILIFFTCYFHFFKQELFISIKTEQQTNLQIYYKTHISRGYSEDKSIVTVIPENKEAKIKVSLPALAESDALRLDFGCQEQNIEITELSIRKGIYLYCVPMNDFSKVFSSYNDVSVESSSDNNSLKLLSTGSDPHVATHSKDFRKYTEKEPYYPLKPIFYFLIFQLLIAALFFIVSPPAQELLRKWRYWLLGITIVFILYPIAYTFDTAFYHSYSDIINGIVPLSHWNDIRGWGFPVYLSFVHDIFGYSANGVLCALLLAYLLTYLFSLAILQKMLSILKHNYSYWIMTVFSIFFISSTIIFGYYHLLLTEFLASSITLGIFYLCLSLIDKNAEINSNLPHRLYCCFVISVCLIFVSQLKPNFLYAIFGMLFITAIFHIRQLGTWKNRLAGFALLIFIPFILLLSSFFLWQKLLHNNNSLTGIGDGYAQRRFIAGVSRASIPEDKEGAVLVKKEKVIVWDSAHENAINEFDFEFQGGSLLNSLQYIAFVMKHNPTALFGGYKDNFFTMINLYHLEHDQGLVYPDIKRKIEFGNAAENNRMAFIAIDVTPFLWDGEGDLQGLSRYCHPYHSPVFNPPETLKVLFKNTETVNNYIFTLVFLLLPLQLIFLLLLPRKKLSSDTEKSTYRALMIASGAVSLGVLVNMLFNAVIDRYIFHVFILQVISVTVFFAFIINLLCKKRTDGKSVIEKESEKNVPPQDQFIVSGKEA